jgi:glycerol kinase
MTDSCIIAIDQSTSGTKAMVVDKYGKVIAKSNKEHKQYYPNPGWVEQDPLEIYNNVKAVIKDVINKLNFPTSYIKAISITNQRETVVVWDKETGKPIYNAIVWQCRRTSDVCMRLKEQGVEKLIKNKTGLLLNPYFSATKVKWILDNVEGAREKANKGKLLLGTIDSWLLWNFTNGKVHATDYTNASRTLLFNIRTLKWDEELLKIFDIPLNMLPKVISSNDVFGYTNCDGILNGEVPITGIIGDSQGALFGQNCFEAGMIKATYGTGSSIMMNVGQNFINAESGLVTSIAWGIDKSVEYVLEGIVNSTGDTLKWLRDNLELFKDYDELEKLISNLKNNEGVYLIPAFSGLGIPYWNMDAKAAIVGMTRGVKKEHIIRAALESIAYQIKDAIDVMKEESGIAPKELRVDGGATNNKFLMQFQADLLSIKVIKTENEDLSALGSAYMAGLGIKLWGSKDEIIKLRGNEYVYSHNLNNREEMEKLYNGWKNAVKMILT